MLELASGLTGAKNSGLNIELDAPFCDHILGHIIDTEHLQVLKRCHEVNEIRTEDTDNEERERNGWSVSVSLSSCPIISLYVSP